MLCGEGSGSDGREREVAERQGAELEGAEEVAEREVAEKEVAGKVVVVKVAAARAVVEAAEDRRRDRGPEEEGLQAMASSEPASAARHWPRTKACGGRRRQPRAGLACWGQRA